MVPTRLELYKPDSATDPNCPQPKIEKYCLAGLAGVRKAQMISPLQLRLSPMFSYFIVENDTVSSQSYNTSNWPWLLPMALLHLNHHNPCTWVETHIQPGVRVILRIPQPPSDKNMQWGSNTALDMDPFTYLLCITRRFRPAAGSFQNSHLQNLNENGHLVHLDSWPGCETCPSSTPHPTLGNYDRFSPTCIWRGSFIP